MSLGDYVAQKMIEKKEDFDVKRNARFAALGMIFVSPVLRVWFHFLDQRIGSVGKFAPLKKVIIDQVSLLQDVFRSDKSTHCDVVSDGPIIKYRYPDPVGSDAKIQLD